MTTEELTAYRQELIAALMRVVEELSPLVAAIATHDQLDPPVHESHGPHFTLAGMRALDKLEFLPNLRRIQAENVPRLTVFDERLWLAGHYQPEAPINEIMEDLTRLRADEVAWLRNLSIPDWSRLGRHPGWGLRSLQWWVEQQLESSTRHKEQLSAFLTQ